MLATLRAKLTPVVYCTFVVVAWIIYLMLPTLITFGLITWLTRHHPS